MQPEPHQNMQAALLGQQGGYKRAERLTAEQRSALKACRTGTLASA